MSKIHPSLVPLEMWNDGWLTLEVSRILSETEPVREISYLMMYDEEKKKAKYPVTRAEMIEFIENHKAKEKKSRESK